jgi:cell wall-associated NlpC family hydrolase
LRHNFRWAGLALVVALFAIVLLAPGSAFARCEGGGLSPAEVDVCTPTAKAKLLANGMLIPPVSAPPRVKAVIAAANKIRSKPYIWGGGHARWWDRGYDCSGSVSFALHGGNFIESPLPSGPM